MELRENLWTQSHKPYLVIYANYIINLSPILYSISLSYYLGFLGGSVVKNPLASAGDTENTGSILGSERSPRGGNGNPLQYSYLEIYMDRGAWRAI